MLYQRKRKQRTVYTQCLYTVNYEGSITTPKGCIQFQIPAATLARFVQETITQHTARMASNDTTRYGYKLGLYDNEKKNIYRYKC